MFKKVFFILILILAACRPAENTVTATPSVTAVPPTFTKVVKTSTPFVETETPTTMPSPVSSKTVRLAWFTKPPEESDMGVVSDNFDLFILTHKDEEARDILREQNTDSYFLQYLTLIEIQAAACDEERPYGNQVAYKQGDFCQISENHPDWFLLDSNGSRITSDGEYYYMDPGSEGYRAFWMERALEMQREFGWNSLFIDNVEASLIKFRALDQIPANYPTDSIFQQAINEFLVYLKQNMGNSTYPIVGNIVSIDAMSVWKEYTASLDGAMIEDFAVGYSGYELSESEWIGQISDAAWALSNGKTLILVSQGEQPEEKRQQFALASYLLISSDGEAFFRYSNAYDYGAVWLYPNYNIELGAAIGPLYDDGITWRRDFEHGSVSVTPATMESEITVSQ